MTARQNVDDFSGSGDFSDAGDFVDMAPPLPPLGSSLPIVSVSENSVIVQSNTMQFGTQSFTVSRSLLPAFQPQVGMLLQFTTDGQVYLIAPSDEEEAFERDELVEETYPDYGEPTYPGSALQAIDDPEPPRAISQGERLYQSRREEGLLPWWHDLIPR